jgi:ACR3 family arsenite efflux pump ArsB
LAVLRYIVLFPIFVSILVAKEAWIEASATHLIATMILFVAAPLILQRAHAGLVSQSTLDTSTDEADKFPQRLGLRDA